MDITKYLIRVVRLVDDFLHVRLNLPGVITDFHFELANVLDLQVKEDIFEGVQVSGRLQLLEPGTRKFQKPNQPY